MLSRSLASIHILDMHGKFKAFLKSHTKEFEGESWQNGRRAFPSSLPFLDVLPTLIYNRVYQILKDTFGFREFRHCQKAVIQALLCKHDCTVLMPTGATSSGGSIIKTSNNQVF